MLHRKYGYVLAIAAPLLVQGLTTPSAQAESYYGMNSGIIRESGPYATESPETTISRFSTVYRKQNRPRIAIFLNRTLSDDVREMRTTRRTVVSGGGSISASSESRFRNNEVSIRGPVAITEQEDNSSAGGRYPADEAALWGLEDGFIQTFLQADATLIDRGTVMRLLARKSGQGTKDEAIEVKRIEMDALTNSADIFIELLITPNPSSPTGHECRAMAKEVKTGRILATATSLSGEGEKYRPKKVLATERGYEIVDETDVRMADVAKNLALDLMKRLLSAWGNR